MNGPASVDIGYVLAVISRCSMSSPSTRRVLLLEGRLSTARIRRQQSRRIIPDNPRAPERNPPLISSLRAESVGEIAACETPGAAIESRQNIELVDTPAEVVFEMTGRVVGRTTEVRLAVNDWNPAGCSTI